MIVTGNGRTILVKRQWDRFCGLCARALRLLPTPLYEYAT
jgi:hypothetical protein